MTLELKINELSSKLHKIELSSNGYSLLSQKLRDIGDISFSFTTMHEKKWEEDILGQTFLFYL